MLLYTPDLSLPLMISSVSLSLSLSLPPSQSSPTPVSCRRFVTPPLPKERGEDRKHYPEELLPFIHPSLRTRPRKLSPPLGVKTATSGGFTARNRYQTLHFVETNTLAALAHQIAANEGELKRNRSQPRASFSSISGDFSLCLLLVRYGY